MCVEIKKKKKRGVKKGLDDGFVLADLYLAEIRIGSFIKNKKKRRRKNLVIPTKSHRIP